MEASDSTGTELIGHEDFLKWVKSRFGETVYTYCVEELTRDPNLKGGSALQIARTKAHAQTRAQIGYPDRADS
jgi:hypothetical protein